MNDNNFTYLLFALLLLLLGIPLAEDLNLMSGPLVRTLVSSILLAGGVWSLKGGGWYFSTGMTFAVGGIILNMLAVNIESETLRVSSVVALFGFLLVAVVYSFKKVVLGTEISMNRLVGAICVYLLLGTIWAIGYSLVSLLSPGSFKGIDAGLAGRLDSEWFYFSFVTMTTLGYGDISPVSAVAQALAYMQAVFGQFYIAILVAGLVSSYISKRQIEHGTP